MTDKVAIYARVSTDEQAERQTIEDQVTACHAYCRAQGWEVVAECKDDGVSGAVPFDQRPEGRRLLALADGGLFTRVVVYCVDRLGRDVVEGSLARKELQRRGTPLEFVLQSFDGTPEGELQFNIFLSFAQYERGVIRRRTMAGRARRVTRGKYQASQAPFGYDYVTCGQRKCEHAECGTLSPNPEQAQIVAQMFKWAAQGVGLKGIATRLEDMGVQPPMPGHPNRQSKWGWHFTTVYKMLTAPRYVGRATYAGEPMACPAIVSEAEYGAAGAALRKRKVDSSRNTRYFYLLQRLLWCRACGGRYSVHTYTDHRARKRDGGDYTYHLYTCHKRASYGPRAGHEQVKWRWHTHELDGLVKGAVRDLYDDPDLFSQRLEIHVERVIEGASEQARRVVWIGERVEALAAEELKVLTWARRGLIDETQMVQQLDQLRAEQATLRDELEQTRQVGSDADLIAEAARWFRAVMDTLPLAEGFFDERSGDRAEPTDAEWRDLIRAVVDRVWVEPDGALTIEGPLTSGSVLPLYQSRQMTRCHFTLRLLAA